MRAALAVVTALLLVAVSYPLQQRALAERATWPASEEFVMLPPAQAAPYLAMGERELMADLTWVRALVYYGSSRHGESELRYLNSFIDNIIELDPRFHRVYSWAAHAVTYKKERATQAEFHTSVKYLERGIEEFPRDWDLLWTLAGRYWFDLAATGEERTRNLGRASDYMERAMRAPGAPDQLPLYAATLRGKLGQHDRALRNLRELILTTDSERAREKMLSRYSVLSDKRGVAEELERAAAVFREHWQAELPYAPAPLYVLLGDPPDPAIDFERLATERPLFGTEEFMEEFGGFVEPPDAALGAAAEPAPPPEPAHLGDGLGDDAGPVHGRDTDTPR